MSLKPCGFPCLPRSISFALGWRGCGTGDKDPVSQLLPPSPLPWLSEPEGLCSLLLPLHLFCLGHESCGLAGRGGDTFSTLREGPGDPNRLGYRFRKPLLSSTCFLTCGHAADTHKIHTGHSGPRSRCVASVGGLSTRVLNPIAAMGRELPKTLDL